MAGESKASATLDAGTAEERPGLLTGILTVKVEEEEEDVPTAAPGSPAPGPERSRRRFRGFRYPEAEGPREALRRLRELCRQWLSPETHTKEQILELLVLEQFLTILPAELQAWVRGQHPESGDEVVVLLEHLQRQLEAPTPQVEAPSPVSNPSLGPRAGRAVNIGTSPSVSLSLSLSLPLGWSPWGLPCNRIFRYMKDHRRTRLC